jgi:hypothetical protein
MSSHVPAELRRLVARRADGLCEYCLIHENDTFLGCQVEHIISEKHGGLTESANLAYACVFCNRFKGTDLGSINAFTGQLVRFFNPRTDQWPTHFRLDGPYVAPLTDIAEATVRIFAINATDRVLERQALIAVGRFPSPVARAHIETPNP